MQPTPLSYTTGDFILPKIRGMATNTNIINQDSLLFRSKQRAELNYQNYQEEKQNTAEKYGFVTLSDKSYKAIQQGEQNIQATQGLVESLLADNDTLASLGLDNNSIAELSNLMQQAADPEAMRDDLITAVAFSQHLNISVSDAMQNLDNLLEAQFYTPVKRGKTAIKAINDSKMLGKLTLDRGIIGSKLKNAEVGSDEYNDLFAQLQAIDEEMVALQDWMPRPWYVALAKLGANSATYSLLSATAGGTGAAVGKALEIAVSMTPLKAALKVPMAIVTGAISAGARGAVAYTVESGNLYYDLVADGIDSEVAKGFSTIYGVAAAATEQVFDAAVSSVLRGFNIPVSNLSSMVVSRLLASGTLKNTAAVFGAKTLTNLFMEGAEEAATSLLEDGATALAYVFNNMLTTTQQKSLPKDFSQVLKDAWKEGLAGAGGSLFLGTAGAALETRLTMKQGIGIANAAKTIHSQQMFEKKAEQFKPEDIADTDWQDLLSKAWEQNAEARDRAWNADEFRAYAEADIYSGGVYNNSGKLYSAPEDLSSLKNKDLFFQESITETENGTVHTLQFGNPDQLGVRASTIDILQRQKEDPTLITEQDIEELKNNDRFAMPSIGTVTFKTTNDGKLNILSSSMENGYESLEKQAIKQVIDMYPDYDISWANTGSKQAIYNELVEENPRGQEAGLNYRERYDDADTAYVLRWLGNHFSQSDAENRVMAILLQHAADRMGLTGEQFINKYSSDIRTIGEEEAKMIRAMGKDPDSVKGFTLSLKEEARAVIYAGKKADVTTFQHELNHVLMGIGENKADFEKAFHQALSTDPERLSMFIEQNIDVIPSATKNGKYDPNFLSTLYNREDNDDRDWTRLEEEFEDQLWEAYHRKGDTLNPELKGFFRRIAESFRRIYKALRNSNGIELNAELRDYYDRIYGFDKDGVDKGRDFSSWEYKRNMSLAQEEYSDVASLSPDDQYGYIRDKYVGSEAYMRAPNGKPSNLTEDQWITVRTPAFKGWFGDWENDPENASKVVDENGEPKQVYHGSKYSGFTVFDDSSNGIFFTDSQELASTYAYESTTLAEFDKEGNLLDLEGKIAKRADHARLYPVFLNLRNPSVIDAQFGSWTDIKNEGSWAVVIEGTYDVIEYANSKEEAWAIFDEIADEHEDSLDVDRVPINGNSLMSTEDFIKEGIKENNDGGIVYNVNDPLFNYLSDAYGNVYIVKNSNQIKSSTNNSGAFSAGNDSILFQDADYDGTVAITADVRKEFERAKEAIPAESNWHDVLFQLKSVTSNVQTSYKGRRDVTYAVSMQPEVYEKFRNKEWKEADFEIESFEQARFINTNEERLKDWQQLYADRMAAKWTVHKRNGTLETKNITFGRMKKNAKKGKVESIPCVDLTIGCQRIRTVIERINNGIMPADTPIESCYGGTCFVNLDQAHKLYGSENVDTKDLVMVTPDDIRRWFSLNTTRKFLQRDTGFIRMGFRGDCAHSFPILDGYNTSLAETWLQCITDYKIRNPKTGELMKTVFITAGYAPTTEESYKRLVKFKDICEIHVSTSGWFSKNELMLRLAEFDVMNKLGLNVSLRVVTDRNSISDSPFNNTNWLKDMIFNVMKVPQTQLLGTAYHNDRSMKHSLFDQDFVNQCCVTGKCISCNVGCMVRNKNSATSKFLAPYGTEFVTEDSYLHKNETKPASFEFEAEEDVFEDNDYLETSRDENNGVLFQSEDGDTTAEVENGTLYISHSISTQNLQKALQMGGFPMPSLAITRPDLSYKTEAYGDVVLIGGWDMAKENLERGSVYDRDLWSPMYPEPKYDSDIKGLADYVTSLNSKYPELKAGGISETEFKANNATDRSAAASRLSYHPTVAMEYLNEAAIEHPSNIDWDGMKEIIHATADSFKAYRNWIEGKLANFYSDPFVTVNGDKKPYTLENILANMQSGRLIGNKFDHQLNKNTTGNLFALSAKSFGSREEMRQAEPLLDKKDPLSVFSNDMNNLAYALQGNGFEFKDYNTALDSVREYLNANAEGIDAMKDILPGEMKINDIVNAAYQLAEAFKTKQASQGFFEAKPGRIVALSEFRVAVVPESISADLYDALAANGLQIVMYNAVDNYNGREEAIADLVETQKDILFQESPQDLWLADIAELANTCTTYEQFRAVVDAFAMGEPTENAEADMRKAFENRIAEEKKTTEPVFEQSENIDFDFDWDSIKVEYYDYDPEPGYDIYDDETEDFIITSWSIAHEEDKTTIYKPNARHLSKDEKIDDFLTLIDDDSQLVAYLNALREANRIVKYGNERDLDFDPKAEADRYKRLMESADIIQQRIAPFIRNIVLGKAAKDGSLDTGRIKGLSDKAKSIVRGIIEKNAAEYIDLFYRATGIDYWNVKAASESDIDAQAAQIAAEKGLSFAEERQIAVDIGDKIIEEKIIKGATVSNQEVRNLVRRNRDRAMLAEQEHQIAEQMLRDRLVVENGKIKQLTIEAQQAQEAISKVETALDEINEKINKAAARISKLANKKGVKDQDDQIVKLIQDKKALEQKKNYLERLKAQRTNYNLKLFHEGKMFSEAGLKKIAEIEAEIAKTIDKITELEKQQVISEDEAIDAIIRLTKGIEREKAKKDLYNALTWERWKASKKLHEAKKKAEADILAQRMHDAVTYGKLYGRQIERLEKANLDLQVARKQERQARRLKAEMERLARQIMKKPSANVDLDEAEQIIQIQQALYPAFQSRMRVDGATYKVEDLRTLIKDPNSPILTLLSPDQLARLTKTSLDQMTLGELKAIAQAVKDLREKGLAKRRQYLIEQRQQAANIQYLLINQLMQSDRYKEPEVRGSLNESERAKKDRWNAIYLSTYNMARKAQMLDGNSKGAFYDLLIRRKRDRQDVQNRGIISRQAPVFAVLQEQGLELDDLYESIEVVIDGKTATFSLSQLAYVYLSINNEKNRAAVAYGNLITEAERLSIKKGVEARIIGGSDMADVRREAYNEELRIIGDRRYQELWEQAEEVLNARPEKLAVFKAMEASLNSDRFDEVVALMRREFNEDIAREGYYLPINRSGIVGESPAEKLKADILNAVPGTRASVNKGMTMQRITISPHHQTSVDLDLVKAWGDSIYDQEHLLAFLEYTRLLDRIFENAFGENTRMLRETIESSYGPAMMREIDTYLKEVANPSAGKIADDMKRAGKLLKAMRGNMYAATFGFRVSSIINQAITSPAPFLGAVRADEYARAAFRFMAHPNEMWAYVCERSSFMANRDMDVAQGIIRDAKESEGQSEFMQKYYSALEVSMLGMQYTDRFTVAIGWLAIYDKEIQRLGGETPENIRQAVKKADEYVQETQPQSDVTELSPIVKSDSWSLIAPFQSALNTVWQNVTYDIPTAFKNGRYAEAIGTIVGYMIGGIMLALVHGDLVPDEDDEKKGWSIARRIFNAGISQFVEGAPLMGDTLSSIIKMVITGEKDFYYGSNDIPLASSLISVSTSVYDKKWLKALESVLYGTGQYFGAPISEIKDIRRAFEEEDWRAIIGWRN